MLLYDLFSAYHVIHAWCEQSKLLKGSLNCTSGNEFFKFIIDGKDCIKPSVKAGKKIVLRLINFWTPISVFDMCANFSESAFLLLVKFRTD